MTDSQKAATTALTTIIGVLTPLTSEERQRIVNSALTFLGEPVSSSKQKVTVSDAAAGDADDIADGDYPTHFSKWMKQNSVSSEELDHVFHFNADNSFDILEVPGISKREQTLNTYVLTGLGNYLAANDRSFADSTARAFCEKIGCYDQANHSVYLKNKGPEFSGDKSRGFVLTSLGVRRGAVLVKEVAGASG
jgi:hypothetical protein